jgi:hypothetical protein
MAHYILKNFKKSQIEELLGENDNQKKQIFRGHYLSKMHKSSEENTENKGTQVN